MTKLDTNTLKTLLTKLEKDIPDGEWRILLEILDITGIADSLQLQQAAGLGRDKLRRTLERMDKVVNDLPPFLREINGKVTRPTLNGRTPKVYRLAESGAALLNLTGETAARPNVQSNPIAIAHALAVLDVHLAAKRAGLVVVTERQISAAGKPIRPDCLVTFTDGTRVLFEVEQQARPDYLPRMTESLRNKIAFFEAGGSGYSTTVRILFNLKPGQPFESSAQRWQELYQLLQKEQGAVLPFKLITRPLGDFLDTPDWSTEINPKVWMEISAPKAQKEEEGVKPGAVDKKRFEELKFTSRQNTLVLKAIQQWFEHTALYRQSNEQPLPDPQFFELVSVIHAASHPQNASPLECATFPYASIHLLKTYLTMYPDLRDRLDRAMSNGGFSIHWNATTILNRMQSVVDTFLAYHGLRSYGTLKAVPVVVDWNDDRPKSFAVQVKISAPALLGDNATHIDAQNNEQALAWLLRALFVHAEQIGLKPPKFW